MSPKQKTRPRGRVYIFKNRKVRHLPYKKQVSLPFYFHPKTRGENRNALQDVFWLPAGFLVSDRAPEVSGAR